MKLSIGIDISKLKLNVSFYNGEKYHLNEYPNNSIGFKSLHNDIKKMSSANDLITMEATGTYHLRVAKELLRLNYKVSVVNPLIIKRYSEMKMLRAKTDSVDSKIISEYGFYQKPAIFKPKSKEMESILQLSKSIEAINKMKIENGNRIEALKQNPDASKDVLNIFLSLESTFKSKIKIAEKKIKELVKDNKTFIHLKTIPGIGDRIGAVIVSIFGKFEDFETAKQVASFIGVNPSPFESGISVKGKGAISKKGNKYLRKLLFMASLSAMRYNKSCKELYERMLLKGKNKRVALIAVANKLVRQMFAIAKYDRMYNENFKNI